MNCFYSNARTVFYTLAVIVLMLPHDGLAQDADMVTLQSNAINRDAQSQALMGAAYFHGINGYPKDLNMAITWLSKAAEQGHMGAAQWLADILLDNHDYRNAFKWLEILAQDEDYIDAQIKLGRLYRDGKGTRTDYKEALAWFEKAARPRNFKPIGADPSDPIFKDLNNARKDMQLLNMAIAEYELGYMYQQGWGKTKNLYMAASFYRKSAEKGDNSGQFGLAQLYYFGDGVPKDVVEAYAWANLSASSGAQSAINLRNSCEASMFPEQIAEAQSLSRRYYTSIQNRLLCK